MVDYATSHWLTLARQKEVRLSSSVLIVIAGVLSTFSADAQNTPIRDIIGVGNKYNFTATMGIEKSNLPAGQQRCSGAVELSIDQNVLIKSRLHARFSRLVREYTMESTLENNRRKRSVCMVLA
jgi:hypothetical protein